MPRTFCGIEDLGKAMATTLADSKSARIETSVEAFEEEVVQTEQDPCVRMTALMHSCCSLWGEWRSLIATISTDWDSLDVHELGDKLRPLITKTARLFHDVKAMAESSQYTQCPLEGSCDLTLACHEIDNAVEWFGTFPTYDSSRRDRSRNELATGKSMGMDKLAKCV